MRTLFWLILTMPIANAQSPEDLPPPSTSTIGWAGPLNPNPSVVIGNGSRPLVTIKADGTIEFGMDYNPDEAARLFWEAIGQRKPKDCK